MGSITKKHTPLFEYTSTQMRKKELIKLGFPKSILEEAANDRLFVKNGFVHKMDPYKRNSPLMYDTAALDAWYRERIKVKAIDQARLMRTIT